METAFHAIISLSNLNLKKAHTNTNIIIFIRTKFLLFFTLREIIQYHSLLSTTLNRSKEKKKLSLIRSVKLFENFPDENLFPHLLQADTIKQERNTHTVMSYLYT